MLNKLQKVLEVCCTALSGQRIKHKKGSTSQLHERTLDAILNFADLKLFMDMFELLSSFFFSVSQICRACLSGLSIDSETNTTGVGINI